MDSDANWFGERGVIVRDIVGQRTDDSFWDTDVLCVSSVTPELVAGNSHHLTGFAQVRAALIAVVTVAAENHRIKGDSIASRVFGCRAADFDDFASGFVAHDDRRDATATAAVGSMDVAAADSASFDFDQDFMFSRWRNFLVDQFENRRANEFESFHGANRELATKAEMYWRKCMGIEPTDHMISMQPYGFEDRGRHQPNKHFRKI